MRTECDEVADNMTTTPAFASFDKAIAYVRRQMPDETTTIVDNVAWSLWRRNRPR